MKITILCENASSDVGCLAEWGFSSYIQTNGINLLFDTGYSDVYQHNAKKAGIDLEATDYIVLSHFHSDHTRGMQYHQFHSRKKVVIHPHVLEKLPREESEKIKNDFEVVLSEKFLEFSENIFYLGEIPRRNDFEKGMHKDDPLLDDSAVAIKTDNGVVVVSGCSHAGICNICEYAKEVTGQKLHAVIGGFHLFEKDQKAVEGTLQYFERERPTHLFPMHCVDFPTLVKFHNAFGCKKYAAGDVISID